jgi:hypothetical protein
VERRVDILLKERWFAVCDRYQRLGYPALSGPETVWVSVRVLIDAVENGGLISYFYNYGADSLAECVAALDVLGARSVREEMERVCALFPGGVPATVEGRNEVIDSWPDNDEEIDGILGGVDERLMPMMPKLEARLHQFLRRSGVVT